MASRSQLPEVQPWDKRILTFQRASLVPAEQCERHYLHVHSAWALREIRAMDDMVGYHTNLFLGQWDLLGGFQQVPDEWRYASMRSRRGGRGGFPRAVLAFLSQDHQNFLSHLRGFSVEESIWVDRRSGQMTSDKYVVVLDRPDELRPEEAVAAAEGVERRLAELFANAYGARLMVVNQVLSEVAYDPLREPGQLINGRPPQESDRLAYIELYFDHEHLGEEFFATSEVLATVRESPFAPTGAAAYHVLERAGHDKR